MTDTKHVFTCAECNADAFVTAEGITHHGQPDEIDHGTDNNHTALEPDQFDHVLIAPKAPLVRKHHK